MGSYKRDTECLERGQLGMGAVLLRVAEDELHCNIGSSELIILPLLLDGITGEARLPGYRNPR